MTSRFIHSITPAWPLDRLIKLEELWERGTSTKAIGFELHCSKNAVVGKVHRMNLVARPSPIQRDYVKGEAKPRIRLTDRLPPTPRAPIIKTTSGPPPQPVPPPRPPAPVYQRPPQCCCWPEGEPGTAGFHFCEQPSPAGKPYCATHSRLAYVRIKERQDSHV